MNTREGVCRETRAVLPPDGEQSKHSYRPKAPLQQLCLEYRPVSASSPLRDHHGKSGAPHNSIEPRYLWFCLKMRPQDLNTAVPPSTEDVLDPAGARLPNTITSCRTKIRSAINRAASLSFGSRCTHLCATVVL